MSRRKAKNKNILIISITSILLLVSILGAIFYKNQSGQPIDKENDEQKHEELTSEKSGKDLDEEGSLDNGQSEQTGNEDGDTQNNDSNSSIGTESSSDTNNSNESTNSSEANKPNDSTSNSGYIEGQPPSSEPTYINGILIVNKKYPLPSTYNKGEDPVAKAALVNMLEAGKAAGYEYDAFSGFRSYEYQTTLYNRYVNRDGKENADRYSARPGHSEHQTGLAFDIGEKGRQDLWLTAEFGETPAGQWLMDNAHHYGFILRYPLGKEHITGFMYESWHYRYVGIEQATVIYNEKTTLEEYLNIQ